MVAMKENERHHLLDVLRFILALIVCYVHTELYYGNAATLSGYLAVDVFFILSGYVLSKQILTYDMSYKSFFISRIARIFPLYWVSFFACLLIHQVNIVAPAGMELFTTEIFLTHNLGLTQSPGLNGVSWSLSVEFWLNVLLFFFLVKFSAKSRAPYIASLVASILVSFVIVSRIAPTPDANIQSVSVFTNVGVIRGYAGLIVGYLAYLVSQTNAISIIFKNKISTTLIETLSIAFLFLSMLFVDSQGYSYLAIMFFFIVILSNKSNNGLLTRLSSLSFVRVLGNYSYGIYLMHIPIISIFYKYFPHSTDGVKHKGILFCVILTIVAIPVYHLFEVPAKKKFQRLLTRLFSA